MEAFIKDITPYLTKMRRMFHAYPEVAWTEYVTTAKIAEEIEKLDFEVEMGQAILHPHTRMGLPTEDQIEKEEQRAMEAGINKAHLYLMKGAFTGLRAYFDTGRKGKHIVLRFDIDALPINEAEDEAHFPFAQGFHSNREGYMHACGHDGHTAIGLGVARFIHENRHQLNGRFSLLFQPGEEGGRGAKPMVDKGLLDDADVFLSGHIGIHSLNVGDIVATTDQFLASTKIDVEYFGKSAHAGLEPNEGRNALLAAAAASLHLNGITRHAGGATRINIGTLEAGSGRNIIADYAKMQLETRGSSTELNEDYMVAEAMRIIHASGALYDVTTNVEIVGQAPSAECQDEWIDFINGAVKGSSNIKNVIPKLPLGASEDAAFMLEKVRQNGGAANYMLFGTPLAAGHHHPSFDYDEEVLPIAVESICRVILGWQ
ncbi:amidohydrolase [Cytobacillus sp. Sa5YUA1]|uniref:Amidohydrolase n=1 Tax=Cytobacillus stercorigallinarum TaxID=2762240 RepID=A0ABR8QQN1_9BACI|nr:amidohydrolase [Cytobacillus stercorigallinarum]MBD7937848.1 amidohydrolase [Cytobacillus stercorigallinarum]